MAFFNAYTIFCDVPVWKKPFDFCDISSISKHPKKVRFSIHIFNLEICLLSLNNLQSLRHGVAEH